MKEIHILHVSDLHYDDGAKAKHAQISERTVSIENGFLNS